jgi:hypothetical protein
MTVVPVIGILFTLLIYIYMKRLYKKVVDVDVHNIPSLKDIEYFSQNIMDDRLLQYPIYIDEAEKRPKDSNISKANFHR